MKLLAFIILVLATKSSGYLIKVPKITTQPVIAFNNWVHRQKILLPLFHNVCENSTDPIIIRLAQEFTVDAPNAQFLKPEVITNLFSLKNNKGLLNKGEIFTETDPEHFNEFKTVFEVLYYSKTFDIFYKSAAWARQNVNCRVFVNAIYLAVINRRDTAKIALPGPFELLPNYFIRKDVIINSSSILSGQEIEDTDNIRNLGTSFTLDANYTSDDAYFLEDISLNSYYYLFILNARLRFNKTETISLMEHTDVTYGEFIYDKIKQLQTRYNLERYSNGMPIVEGINWDSVIQDSYDSMLIYSNGNEFSKRTETLDVPNDGIVSYLKNIESQIKSYKTQPYQSKSQILDKLMDILVLGEKNYKDEAGKLLGKDATVSSSSPSVLEHYMTSLRDPMFWRINQKIIDLVDDILDNLPGYSRSELLLPGVQVMSVDVKKMITNFETFDIDVTDSLKIGDNNVPFQVKIDQMRLNHKPFTIKLNISSLISKRGLIKIYLGPKSLPGKICLKSNFMLLDSFEYSLKMGTNIITRSSEEIENLSQDFISFRILIQNVEDAEFGLDSLALRNVRSVLDFPSRLILPKGTFNGLPMQLFIFVAPFVKATMGSSQPDINRAVLSPGYPFDMTTQFNMLNLPNAFIKDIAITHKGIKSASFIKPQPPNQQDYTRPYGPVRSREVFSDDVTNYSEYNTNEGQYKYKNSYSTRPESSQYQYKKEPFDYNAKKAQYGNRDFSSKREQYNTNAEDVKPNETAVNDAENVENEMQNDAVSINPLLRFSYLNDEDEEDNTRPNNIKYDYKLHKFDYKTKKKELEMKQEIDKKSRIKSQQKNIGSNDLERTDLSDVITMDNMPIENDDVMDSIKPMIFQRNYPKAPTINNFLTLKRSSGVFDYLFPNYFDDKSDSKENVYE